MKKRINGAWVTKSPLRYGTATDTLTSFPATVIPDGTNASADIIGNMVQSGTPSPSSPIYPSETGDKTANLFDKSNTDLIFTGTTLAISDEWNGGGGISKVIRIPCEPLTTYTISGESESNIFRISLSELETAPDAVSGSQVCIDVLKATSVSTQTFTTTADTKYILVQVSASAFNDYINVLMLNTGSTALPYEPYGYKIPIISGGVTTPLYLGEVQSTRRIKKLVLTGEETWTKNELSDINNYLYYANRYNALPGSLSKPPLLCNELPVTNGAPQNDIGINTNNSFGVIYVNFGGDVMNAQLSGNTINGLKEYLAQQYANGTPVAVWYILATPQTSILNEPLRKIGDYADSVSVTGIPTTAGSQTFDVDTSLKPSECDLTYHGWHRKEPNKIEVNI